MSRELVQRIKDELVARNVPLSGPCGAFEITKRVAWALRGEGYGLLGGKTLAQNGCTVGSERYSVDWILKPTGMGRDVLRDAGGANEPQWNNEEQADPAHWRPPIDPDPRSTHKYIDGQNDTGICDVCRQPRTDPVHEIPESKVNHHYDGGENDTGLCDICQKPREHSIHARGGGDEAIDLLRQILESNVRQEQKLDEIRRALSD
jgi:hypothetical protein